MAKYDELRELAKYASPGPWTNKQDHVYQARGWELAKTFNLPQDRNAAYIAAASPDVLLALLDERGRLLAAIDALEAPDLPYVAGHRAAGSPAWFEGVTWARNRLSAVLNEPVEATS